MILLGRSDLFSRDAVQASSLHTRIIYRALELPGFTDADVVAAEGAASAAAASGMGSGRREVTVGFGHEAVLSVAGDVVQAVQEERLKHIFLIGESCP